MSAGTRLPSTVRRLLTAILPADRRDDVLDDLEASYRARATRNGSFAARRRLAREVAGLLLWRIGAGLRPAGGASSVTDTPRVSRLRTWGRDLRLDVRFGLRTLARQPGFTLAALAVLGLGIGAPVTVFTLVNRIFFEAPAEVVEPQRLVTVYRGGNRAGSSLPNADYFYYRDRQTTLSGLAAAGMFTSAAYSLVEGEADQLRLRFVSDNYFDVLGVQPVAGRFFARAENATPGTDPVVVISEAFRRRALGTEDIVGRTLRLNGRPFTVIGVAPGDFRGLRPIGQPADAWVPIAMYGALTRTAHTAWWERLPNQRFNWLTLVGRLAPGETFAAAQANLQALSDALEYEGRDPADGVMVSRQVLYPPAAASSLATLATLLLAVVGVVLIVASANVAVLLLSRASARARELGIRTAMGAGTGRIVRQLLTESLLLGIGGGAVGVGLAYLFADTAATLLPFRFDGTFVPDPGVLLAAAGLSLLSAVAAGLVPALLASRADVVRVIGDARAGRARSRLRDALVVGQVALSLVLVAAALLFARSFRTALTQEVGWRADHRLVVGVDLRGQGLDEPQGRAFVRDGINRIAALPGVTAVATSRMVPFQGDWSSDFEPEPELFPDAPEGVVWIGVNVVGPGYFELMGIDIVQGRAPGPEDRPGAPPAVVVNETLAQTLWPGQAAVGKTLPNDFFASDAEELTVVGVARDATYYELGEDPVAQLYGAATQVYTPDLNFLVATEGDPVASAAAVQAALRTVDPDIAFGQVTTLAAVFEEQVARYRVSAVLVGLFSAIALLLAATGLYGVVSFLVARRTRDIGVRMALGAPRARVAGEVLAAVLRLTAAGCALGLAGALAVRRFTAGMLYEVAPQDPWPLVGATLTLAVVMLLAALVPTRRAMRVDPAEAIRTD